MTSDLHPDLIKDYAEHLQKTSVRFLSDSSFLYIVNRTEQNYLLNAVPHTREPESCQQALIHSSPENRAVFTATIKPLRFEGHGSNSKALSWPLFALLFFGYKPLGAGSRTQYQSGNGWVKLHSTTRTTCVCVCVLGGGLSRQPWARQADDTRPCPWPWHGYPASAHGQKEEDLVFYPLTPQSTNIHYYFILMMLRLTKPYFAECKSCTTLEAESNSESEVNVCSFHVHTPVLLIL